MAENIIQFIKTKTQYSIENRYSFRGVCVRLRLHSEKMTPACG